MGFKSLRQILAFVLAGLLLSGLISLSQAQSPPQEDDAAHIQRLYTGFAPQRVLPAALEVSPTEEVPSTSQVPGGSGLGWSVATFSEYNGNRWEIVLIDPNGAYYRSYHPAGNQIEPHLDATGMQVVFTSVENNVSTIYKADKKGLSEFRDWVLVARNGSYPNWSPDNSKIVFQSERDGQYDIYLVNADGTGLTRLTNDPEYDGQPSFSRDGNYIYFVSRRSGGYRIYRMNLDGSDVVQLSTLPYSARPYEDGEYIWFSADNNLDGWQEVWRMPLDGSKQQLMYRSFDSNVDLWVYSARMGGAYSEVHWVQYQGQWYWSQILMKPLKSWLTPIFWSNKAIGYDWASQDTIPPVTNVSLPSLSPAEVQIKLSVSDEGGAGVALTEVQYRDQAGNTWLPALEVPNSGSSVFTFNGRAGHTYEVRARSIDYGENKEPWSSSSQTLTTTIETDPPRSSFAPISIFQPPAFSWPISVWDRGGSQIQDVFADFRQQGSNNWTSATVVQQSQIQFQGMPGASYEFRLRAQDTAGNREDWHQYKDAIKIYSWGIRGRVYNIAGMPLSNVEAHLLQDEVGSVPSDSQGVYTTYGILTSTQQVLWNRLGQLPVLSQTLNTTNQKAGFIQTFNVVLPPQDNLLANSGFERGLSNWGIKGSYSSTLATISYIGNASLGMGTPVSFAPKQILDPLGGDLSSPPVVLVDQADTIHVVWVQNDSRVLYREKPLGGQWSAPQTLYSSTTYVALHTAYLLTNGTLRLFLEDPAYPYLFLLDRYATGETRTIFPNVIPRFYYSITGLYDGAYAHMIYHYYDTGGYHLYYTRVDAAGVFSIPEPLDALLFQPLDPKRDNKLAAAPHTFRPVSEDLFTDEKGNVYYHLAGRLFTRSADTQTWDREWVPLPKEHIYHQLLGGFVDIRGRIHLLVHQDGMLYHLYRENGQWQQGWQTSCSYGGEAHAFKGNDQTFYLATFCNSALHLLQISNDGRLYHFEPFHTEATGIQAGKATGKGVYIACSNGFLYWVPETGWHEIQQTDPMAHAAIDSQGVPHYVKFSWPWERLVYQTLDLLPANLAVTVQQQITIPPTMTNPTLSFLLNRQHVWLPDSVTWLSTITTAEQPTVTLQWRSHLLDKDWFHYWADLSAWAGKTVTVTFYLGEKAGYPKSQMLIDEVFLGSVYPDAWVQLEIPKGAPVGKVLRLKILYGNRSVYDFPDAILRMSLPDTLQVLDIWPSAVQANGEITWTLGTLRTGATGYVNVLAKVRQPLHGEKQMTLRAELLPLEPDADPYNNQVIVSMDFNEHIFLPLVWR